MGLVVHEEELDVLNVADEESLVAGGHHVAGLLVGAIADLNVAIEQVSRCPSFPASGVPADSNSVPPPSPRPSGGTAGPETRPKKESSHVPRA